MKILVIDEDTRDVPQICDELGQDGHEVRQVSDWKKIESAIEEFHPDAILLDLMMPPIGLPSNDCGSGFTTGAFLYDLFINKSAPGVPFAVFSSVFLETPLIKQALQRLKEYPEFRGVVPKGCTPAELLNVLNPPMNKASN